MSNIMFHIGYHKTATSWMQNELFIADSKNFVPLSERKKGHASIANDFIYDKKGFLLSSFDNNEQNILSAYEKISKDLLDEDKRVRVISHERLSGNPHSSGFDAALIAQRIQKTFPKAKIFITIREQTSWILSNYFQYLSIGGTHSLKKYLTTKYDGKRPGFSPSHIMYHHLIQHYFDLFGKKNVLVLPFETLFSKRDFFLSALGGILETDLSNENPNFDKKVNAKKNHFLNYYSRVFNPLMHSSSVNNNLGLSNGVSRKAIKFGKKALGVFIPKRMNESIKENLRKEIIKLTGDGFHQSNQITQDLIDIDLGEFGYCTSVNKRKQQ